MLSKATISTLTAVCASTMTALVLGMGVGLTTVSAVCSLALGFLAGTVAWQSLAEFPKGEPARGWAAWAVITVFVLFALRAFCWVLFSAKGELHCLSPNNLGDLSLHLTYIRWLAHAPFWPENPIFAGTPLHYPFGVDLWNALLLKIGVDVQRGLVWMGLLGALATGVALWRWGGVFTMAGFLFNGGIAGFVFLKKGMFADYQAVLDWQNLPLTLFVAQRGFLYAIPVGLFLLWSWRARFLEGKPGLPFWIEWLLYATMPLFHLHTFIFLSVMLGCWLVLPARAAIFRLGVCAFLPATALVLMLTGGGESAHVIRIEPKGWLKDNVWQNFGFWPLAIAALLAWLWWRKQKPLAAVALPALSLFIITLFVIFAQWTWDNTKLMLWCYLAILPPLWAMLRELPPHFRTFACVLLFFSGAISLFGGLSGKGYQVANEEELDQIKVALHDIPPTATFACRPTFNHPLLLLGHKVVAGYAGHLASHGTAYKPRFFALKSVMHGDPGWETRARELGADYLFWGRMEQEEYGYKPPWQSPVTVGFPLVVWGPWGVLYSLSDHPTPR